METLRKDFYIIQIIGSGTNLNNQYFRRINLKKKLGIFFFKRGNIHVI